MEFFAPFRTGVLSFIGGLDEALTVLLDFMLINLIIYFIYLIHSRNKNIISLFISSIIKKFVVLSIIAVTYSLDRLSGVEAIRQVTIYFFIAGEAKYILHFAACFGINVPERIMNTLDGFNNIKINNPTVNPTYKEKETKNIEKTVAFVNGSERIDENILHEKKDSIKNN